jgi:RimJ/RimL family protein N-acetyltransferase
MNYQIGDITLQDFKLEDVSHDYLSWLNDKDYMKFSRQSLITHDATSVAEFIDDFKRTNDIFLSIKRNSILIGTLTIYIDSDYQVCSPGILIGKSFAKLGYGEIVWQFVIGTVSKDLQMRKVSAGTMISNRPMIKLFEKSGMEFEATLLRAALLENVPTDIVLYRYFI